jgi:putative transport protein
MARSEHRMSGWSRVGCHDVREGFGGSRREQDRAAQLGSSIFLGQVAIASGRPFVDTLASQGGPVGKLAAASYWTLFATVLVVGQRVRIRFDDLLGVCVGPAPTQPSGASRILGSNRPDVGILFPTTTIAKIIAEQLMLG